jgi:hypothetical protein
MLAQAPTAWIGFVPKTPEVARRLVERYGALAASCKPESALQALLRRIRRAGYDWQKLAASDRLDAVWVLWEGTNPPAEHASFLRDFLAWLETPWRRLQASRLAAAWVAAFDPAVPSIRTVGAFLARHAGRLPDPWARHAADFAIFSIEEGPLALAQSFLAGDEAGPAFFDRLRLPGESGLALATLQAAAAIVEERAADEPRLAARLRALAMRGDTFLPNAARSRFPHRVAAIRSAIAEALLLPWQDETPPTAAKAECFRFLLRHYGDARIEREQWAGLRAPAAAIMLRWLVEQSIASYFRLAAATEREAFWHDRLAAIADAWLVTGPRAAAALGPDPLARGSLIGCRPDRAALILRVGGMTILESSSAPAESVWLPGNALAPPLYRRPEEPYLATALATGADFSSAFRRRDNSSWQERLAEFIERNAAA